MNYTNRHISSLVKEGGRFYEHKIFMKKLSCTPEARCMPSANARAAIRKLEEKQQHSNTEMYK